MIISIILTALVCLPTGAFFYAQYHSSVTADLQKAKTDAEFLLANARAELASIKSKLP